MRSVDTWSDLRALESESDDKGRHVLLIIYAGLGLLGVGVTASATAFLGLLSGAASVYLAMGGCLVVAAAVGAVFLYLRGPVLRDLSTVAVAVSLLLATSLSAWGYWPRRR